MIASLNRRIVLQGPVAGAIVMVAGSTEGNAQMMTRRISVERVSVTSSKPFETVVAALDAVVGRPNMAEFRTAMAAATTFSEMQQVIQHALGKSGFMEFLRFDLGSIIQRERGQGTPKILRLVIGNPLVMKEMVKHVADAGSYAPVTVLVDERPDGVHLSYDKMESFLTPYGNPDAVKVARDLDAKVEALLIEAAG
jgi:uncharacterized protein (DUF302 family)